MNQAAIHPEVVFLSNCLNPVHDTGQAWLKAQAIVRAKTRNDSNQDPSIKSKLHEMFVQGDNLLPGRWATTKFRAAERC